VDSTPQDLKAIGPAPPPLHPWREYLGQVRTGRIVWATAYSFVVHTGYGEVSVDAPGGLTAALYRELAPLLSDEEKAVLAFGVLENDLGLKAADFDTLRGFLWDVFGPSEEDWLPPLIEAVGFDVIADKCRDAIRAERASIPPPRIRVAVFTSPRWCRRSRTLTYGQHRWRFRDRSVMVFAVLDALEDARWRPAMVIPYARKNGARNTTYMDVRYAVQYIKSRTGQVLKWTACNDGQVSCVPR
jgi:hypothetical protein